MVLRGGLKKRMAYPDGGIVNYATRSKWL